MVVRPRFQESVITLAIVAGVAVGVSRIVPVSASGLLAAAGLLLAGVAATLATAMFLVWVLNVESADERKRPAMAVSAAVIELARLGLLLWIGAEPADAVWLGLGAGLAPTVLGAVPGMLRTAQPRPAEHRRWFVLLTAVGSPGVNVGFCLLLVWSPWLAVLTVPLGVAFMQLEAPDDEAVPPQLVKVAVGVAAVVVGVLLG